MGSSHTCGTAIVSIISSGGISLNIPFMIAILPMQICQLLRIRFDSFLVQCFLMITLALSGVVNDVCHISGDIRQSDIGMISLSDR